MSDCELAQHLLSLPILICNPYNKTMTPQKYGTLSMMRIKSSWRKHRKFQSGLI